MARTVWLLALCVAAASAYRAAVVQHTVLDPLPSEDASAYQLRTLNVFEKDVIEATKSGAAIVVFPEFAMFPKAVITACGAENAVKDYCEDVPALGSTPCSDDSAGPVATKGSCMAAKHGVITSINLCGIINGTQYNTEYVFGTKGELLVAYPKTHPFLPTCFSKPAKAEIATFEAPLGLGGAPLRFGVFTCFDIMFQDPAVELVNDGVRHFLYSDSIPRGPAAVQAVWSKAHQSVLIASNLDRKGGGVFVNGTRVSAAIKTKLETVAVGDVDVSGSGVATDRPIWDVVNQLQNDWVAKADESPRTFGFTPDVDARAALASDSDPDDLDTIPPSFDWRQASPSCVHPIRNQGGCGSCWAFGTTEALSDRFCIASNGSVSPVLSPEELADCNLFGIENCARGGDPATACIFASTRGIVSEQCYPYTAGSAHHTGHCSHTCTANTTASWKPYKTKLETIRWHRTEASMQAAILSGGPVVTCFKVYEDFVHYKSGVYSHVTGNEVGGHCVKVVGWGTTKEGEEATPYWIVANSWGTDWGLDGFFWMRRGANECNFEREAFSATPDLQETIVA